MSNLKAQKVPKKLTHKQVAKMVELRLLEEPVTITNLAKRFGVSERTVYYYLAQYRDAQMGLSVSVAFAERNSV